MKHNYLVEMKSENNELNPNHINDLPVVHTIVRKGEKILTAYGDFELLDFTENSGRFIWTIYNEHGGIFDETVCMMTADDLGEYMQMTDCKRHIVHFVENKKDKDEVVDKLMKLYYALYPEEREDEQL